MAQIDLKNCDVYLVDGYAGPGGAPIVGTAGATLGATTVPVLGLTGTQKLTVGDTITIASNIDTNGDKIPLTVVTTTETSGHTTSITITPALAVAAVSADIIAVLPHYLKIRIGEGNASWTEKRAITYVKDRGRLDTVRLGDEDPVEVKLDATWVFLASATGDTTPQIEEVLKKTGKASGWISSSSDPCEPYCVDIVIVYVPPCTVLPETYTLQDFRYEELAHDLKQGQISITGKCNVVAVTATRAAVHPPLV